MHRFDHRFDLEAVLYLASPSGFLAAIREAKIDITGTDQPHSHVAIQGEEARIGDVPTHYRLALAVLSGDTGAALLLADLVQEQHTGRESELQAEMKRRVDEEVAKIMERATGT